MQNNFASPSGDGAVFISTHPMQRALSWAWKVGLVVGALLGTPAAIGAPLTTKVRQQEALAFNFTSTANQTAALSVAGDGSKSIVVTDDDDSTAMTLSITGRADENEIELRVDSERDASLILTYATGESVTLSLIAQPDGTAVTVNVDEGGELSASVTDPSTDRVGVAVTLTAIESSAALTIMWDILPAEEATDEEGRVTPRFPGFLNGNALGGSVTLSAIGMTSESATVLSLSYADGDTDGLDESDIRVHRFENSTGAFEPVGSNQRGIGSPSRQVGDFGVDTDGNAAWGVIDQLGTFAVGITDDTLSATVEDDDLGGNGLGGNTTGICGALGAMGLFPMIVGLVVMRPRRRGR